MVLLFLYRTRCDREKGTGQPRASAILGIERAHRQPSSSSSTMGVSSSVGMGAEEGAEVGRVLDAFFAAPQQEQR